MLKQTLRRVVAGLLEGLIFFVVLYWVLPSSITSIFNVPVSLGITSTGEVLLVGLFISLGLVASCIKPPIGVIFEAIIILLSLLLVVRLLGVGQIETGIYDHGSELNVTLEFKPVFTLIVCSTIIYAILRLFERAISGGDPY